VRDADAVLERKDTLARGKGNRFRPAPCVKLGQHRADMEFDGVITDSQRPGDGLVRQPGGHQLKHFPFPRAQGRRRDFAIFDLCLALRRDIDLADVGIQNIESFMHCVDSRYHCPGLGVGRDDPSGESAGKRIVGQSVGTPTREAAHLPADPW